MKQTDIWENPGLFQDVVDNCELCGISQPIRPMVEMKSFKLKWICKKCYQKSPKSYNHKITRE